MASHCRRLTADDLINKRIPENAELIYSEDNYDKGGPVIMTFRPLGVPEEEQRQNYEDIQERLQRACQVIAEKMYDEANGNG